MNVYLKNIETEKENTSKKLMEIKHISMLDVPLNNLIDVLMDHVEQDKSIVLFSQDVHKLNNHLDVIQEDVLKMQLHVNLLIRT